MGFIGSHTVVSLMAQGLNVVIIDNLVNSTIETLDGIEAITGVRPKFHPTDLTDAKALDQFVETHQDAVAVIHFAALKAVGESGQKPLLYYRNNSIWFD